MSLSEQRGWILMEGTTVFTGLHHGIDSENYMMDKAIIWADMLNNQKRPLKWAEATASGTSVDWKVVRSREEFSDAAAELTAYLMEISRQFPDLEIEFLHMRSEGDRTDHLKEADAELNVTSPTLRCSCGELIHQEILGKAPDYCDSCIDRLDEIDQEINDVIAGLLCHSCRCPIGDGNEAGEPRYCKDCIEDDGVPDNRTTGR